ncbi:MAG: Gfo/Idh/MocA family oxidoreductase [Chloroflexi bacterium]|nr:Gfo/Idh/MocA family oxidoreductase [Chloroflexota bacterium]MCY4247358.1 Gfo/Idh/MocA family oxidoreductase [Chloroflexota bacterium]
MKTRVALIGAGGMARHHLPLMVETGADIRVVCEPSGNNYELTVAKLAELGAQPPPNQPDLTKLLDHYRHELDAVFIITPHNLHHDQAKACLEAGLDVLLEKPMVLNGSEAISLMAARDRTSRHLVVAFQGGLSPQIRHAAALIASGELGELLTVTGMIWQGWKSATTGSWRQIPEIAGGGFLFDSGAHMLNTICTLVGEDFASVAAWTDNRGAPVDINGVIMGRLGSGALVTINGCGDCVPGLHSEIYLNLTGGAIRTGIYGERLLIRREGESDYNEVDLPPMRGAWEQFTQVRAGEIENPCPPEVGLRMAKLWDAIVESAGNDGQVVAAV